MKHDKMLIIILMLSACNPGPSSDSESQAARDSHNASSRMEDNTHFPGCQIKFRSYWDRCLYQKQQAEPIKAAGYQGVYPVLDNSSALAEGQGNCVDLPAPLASKLLAASPVTTNSLQLQTKSIVPVESISTFARPNEALMKEIFNHWRLKHPNEAQAGGNQGNTKCEQFQISKNGSVSYIWELGDTACPACNRENSTNKPRNKGN